MNKDNEAPRMPEFTGIRAVLWPVHNFEVKKFLPMCLMMLFILFAYNVLRDTKDTIVVTNIGAEALAFTKLYGTTPAAILFMLIYVKLANVLSREALFYASLVPFLIFFGAFGFIIYPNRETLHMSNETIAAWQASAPAIFYWFIPIIGKWSYALFYILSELWGSVVLSLLFWQFANEITRVSEAKRFYGLFSLIGNAGLMFAGTLIIYASNIRQTVPVGVDAWGRSLIYLMSLVMVAGLVIIAIYWWMNRKVLTSPLYYDGAKIIQKKDKPKFSVLESLRYITTNPYLGLIAMLVLGYGICINLVEGVWKSQIGIRFPNENDYNTFMGAFTFTTGASTILMTIIGNNILRRFSWRTAALMTPLMFIITAAIFFALVIYNKDHDPFTPLLGTTMVMLAVLVGMAQNILGKATKYSLFDPTKEMAYIPLDQELKVKGKAAVDVIGGRAGKSGGAMIQTILVMATGGKLITLSPYFAMVFLVIAILWIVAVVALAKRFYDITKKKGAAA